MVGREKLMIQFFYQTHFSPFVQNNKILKTNPTKQKNGAINFDEHENRIYKLYFIFSMIILKLFNDDNEKKH